MRAARYLMLVAMAAGMLAGVTVRADDLGTQLKGRADEVGSGKRPLGEVRIDAIWSREGRTSLTAFGNGVGILSHERQFQVSTAELRDLLKLFAQHGFFEMPKPWEPLIPAAVEEEVEQ